MTFWFNIYMGGSLKGLCWTCVSKVNMMSVQAFLVAGHATPFVLAVNKAA